MGHHRVANCKLVIWPMAYITLTKNNIKFKINKNKRNQKYSLPRVLFIIKQSTETHTHTRDRYIKFGYKPSFIYGKSHKIAKVQKKKD